MKNLCRVAIIACLFLFSNCEIEEKPSELNLEKESQKAGFSIIDSKDFPTDKRFQINLSKLKELQNKTSNSKSSIFSDGLTNITIDLSQVKYYSDPVRNYHSYTFTVIERQPAHGIRNIVLSLQPNGNYKKLSFTYDISDQEIEKIRNNESLSLKGKISIDYLDDNSFNIIQNKLQYYDDGCYYDEQFAPNTCASGQHQYGDTTCSYLRDGSGRQALPGGTTVISLISCDPTNGGGSNTGSQTDGGDTTSPTPCGRFCLDVTLEDNCRKIKKQAEDNPYFMQTVKSLHEENDKSFESFATLDSDGDQTQNFGNSNEPFVTIPPDPVNPYISIAHTHPGGGELQTYSIFSYNDLRLFSNLIHNGKLQSSNFVAYLTTSKGTNYAITIKDVSKLQNFFLCFNEDGNGQNMTEWINSYNSSLLLLNKYFLGYENNNGNYVDPLITEHNTDNEDVLKKFLEFLEEADLGILISETDENFENPKMLKLFNNTITREECNL